ncbi:hypothetical protein SKAU_G00410970 [Synaphobranchus kaupii]|uniref:Reverse transcriptase domain-containing protein n=1 Tax=Synaphobranchus kaupii TaxID=118154 RepID=A0A9Q1I9S9_SYNKA|nr:hypothetical protein SKAU_G00410970 [Synaphobranchus kaupii]
MMEDVEELETQLKDAYDRIRVQVAPSTDIRRKMDSCEAVTMKLMDLMKVRMSETGLDEFDAEAEKTRLDKVLDVEYARSIFGSTVARPVPSLHSNRSSGQHSLTVKRAECAAALAAKKAEIEMADVIAAQTLELKRLENQRDLKVIAAKLKAYSEADSSDYEPYAIKTDLGWSIVGGTPRVVRSTDVTGLCHCISVKELPPLTPASVIRALESDFKDTNPVEKSISQDDIQFLQTLNGRIHQNIDSHLELPLPFKARPQLPDNKQLALVRLRHLKRKLEKNPKFKDDYVRFMEGIFKDGDAERAENEPEKGNVWYIPHQGVYHPRKPDKIRVVFDCSAKYDGTALNDHLLTGPDLTNGLTGVLCRFRKHPIAIMCDVEKMFHRFHVDQEDRDYLRFMWWENGELNSEPKEYRMKVHLFGAASSPGCANYGMKYLASQHDKEYPLAANFIKESFYVDDGLVSVEHVDTAIRLVKEAQEVFAEGRLHLHKLLQLQQQRGLRVSP